MTKNKRASFLFFFYKIYFNYNVSLRLKRSKTSLRNRRFCGTYERQGAIGTSRHIIKLSRLATHRSEWAQNHLSPSLNFLFCIVSHIIRKTILTFSVKTHSRDVWYGSTTVASVKRAMQYCILLSFSNELSTMQMAANLEYT